jgi:ABC-type dipeptide/oligopeptide/nickel transport system permease subunit
MERQLSAIGYWLGLISTVLALAIRIIAVFHAIPSLGGASAITYTTFLHGGALFFLLAIASWCRTAKS